jgi:hypothetical protein
MFRLAVPLGVELLNRLPDAEARRNLAKSFALFGFDVGLHSFSYGHSGLAQSLRLASDPYLWAFMNMLE